MRKILLALIIISVCIASFGKNKEKPKDKLLTYDRLKTVFPNHLIVKMNQQYHLSMPKKELMNGDLLFNLDANKPFIKDVQIKPNYIVFPTKDTMNYRWIPKDELDAIIPQISTLLYSFKCLGTDFYPNIKFQTDADTYLIHYKDDKKTKKEYSAYRPVLDMFHQKWKKNQIYLRLNDAKKINDYTEFSINLISINPKTKKKDFVDIRFHFNLKNEIDLVMFFYYEDVSE